jgi:hypothetical protein
MAIKSFTNISLPPTARNASYAVSKSDVESMILGKLNIDSVASAWTIETTYSSGDYVIDNNVLYRCTGAHTSSNSNKPSASNAFWSSSYIDEMIDDKIADALAPFGRYTGYITGDGASRTYNVRHDLNSLLILTEVVDADGNTVYPNVQRIDADNIQLQFGTAPSDGAVFTILIRC